MNRRDFIRRSALFPALLAPLPAMAQGNEFSVGMSADLSGPLQNLGRDYFTGAKLAFDQANAAGGGRRIRLIQIDDAGDPARAIANTQKLLASERVDVLFGYTGDAAVSAVAASPVFRQSGRALFAPMSGVDVTNNDRIVFLRATYAEEVATVLARFARIGLASLAIAHTSGPASAAARNAAVALMRERKAPDPMLFTLADDGRNASALARDITNRKPQAIVILADTIAAGLLARELIPRSPGLFVCMISTVDVMTLQQIVGPKDSVGIVVSRVVPDPARATAPIARDFARAAAKMLDEAPSATSFEGYLAARALLAAMQRGTDFGNGFDSRRLRALDLGGWSLDFSRGNRASHYVDTSVISRTGTLSG
ncbi:ABC transporter substrate-binding protein [Uliginosibacterium sp. sgz301328]|uniref:ABC transporter substrate-binding protein n=1 Tax=Uliginosibacterium sp. sgz301328 TaxID=3243764 RepID=UPI00359EE848